MRLGRRASSIVKRIRLASIITVLASVMTSASSSTVRYPTFYVSHGGGPWIFMKDDDTGRRYVGKGLPRAHPRALICSLPAGPRFVALCISSAVPHRFNIDIVVQPSQ
jgi:hypothetical protein